MVTLRGPIYRILANEIIRWTQLLKTDLMPDILTPHLTADGEQSQ